MLIIVSVEGVLIPRLAPLSASPSLASGRRLIEAFGSDTSLMYLSAYPSTAAVERWLSIEGFTRRVRVATMEGLVDDDPLPWKVKEVSSLLGSNAKPALYIDGDPTAVRAVSAIGVPSLLMVGSDPVPGYDGQYQPWSELAEDIEVRQVRQAERLRQQGATG